MKYKDNWIETKNKFKGWWKQSNTGRPLMIVIAKKENANYKTLDYESLEQKYMDANYIVNNYRRFCENHDFLAESFPNVSVDFGPGSLAGYLGSDIVFGEDTVWFDECVDSWNEFGKIKFNPNNKWFRKHIDLIKNVKQLAGDDFYVCIPDLIENIDTLASLRGAQDILFDMIDNPDELKKRINEIDEVYFEYYNRFYDIVKDKNNNSAYTVFQIWGEGKCAKIQCDFSAMLSPDNFREFIQKSLRKQARKLDNVLYHLDGPDAIKHVDAIMEIDEIDALQWTSGDHTPEDGACEKWYEIYDKAVKANKSLWVKIYTGDINNWISGVDKLVKRYGSNRLFLHFPIMSREEANQLIEYAEKNWSDITGEIS